MLRRRTPPRFAEVERCDQSVYDGHECIAEYSGTGTLLRKYIYGPGVDQPVCMIDVEDSGAVYYYHHDALGSVVALSDSAGDTVQLYDYDVYGNFAASDQTHPNPYLFTGRRYDIETNLYYYRARHYNPYLGRFLQTDPIGYGDGMNLYAYCSNNPVNCLDPFGLEHFDLFFDPATGTWWLLLGEWNEVGMAWAFYAKPGSIVSHTWTTDDDSFTIYTHDGPLGYAGEAWFDPNLGENIGEKKIQLQDKETLVLLAWALQEYLNDASNPAPLDPLYQDDVGSGAYMDMPSYSPDWGEMFAGAVGTAAGLATNASPWTSVSVDPKGLDDPDDWWENVWEPEQTAAREEADNEKRFYNFWKPRSWSW